MRRETSNYIHSRYLYKGCVSYLGKRYKTWIGAIAFLECRMIPPLLLIVVTPILTPMDLSAACAEAGLSLTDH